MSKWTIGGVSFQNKKEAAFANLKMGDILGKQQGMIGIGLVNFLINKVHVNTLTQFILRSFFFFFFFFFFLV